MTEIQLTNSATHRKARFEPIDPQNVRLYVCGPTVYDRAHMGNARPAIVFDALYRLLRHVYGPAQVKYVRNITDVDDKINARAAETGRSIGEIADETTAWYLEDMAALGTLVPDETPRATGYIAEMVAMIETLVAGGHAYEVEGHVLFSVGSYDGYGELSGRSVEDMIAGARVEVAPYKRDAMDFVLWKPSGEGQPGWPSPWGTGRPGWHIECSAMARTLLGEAFDIHGGGGDLIFPHHENEVAQSACAHGGAQMARVWMHNEMLQVDGRKMSKSLGNFYTVRDLLDEGVPGSVIRMAFLLSHYRSPMNLGEARWQEARAALADLAKALGAGGEELRKSLKVMDVPPHDEVVACLADDLDTPGAVAALRKLAKAKPKGAEARAGHLARVRASLTLLGFDLLDSDTSRDMAAVVDQAVDMAAFPDALSEMLAGIGAARAAKEYDRADALRGRLEAAGIEVQIGPQGAAAIRLPHYDASKLGPLE